MTTPAQRQAAAKVLRSTKAQRKMVAVELRHRAVSLRYSADIWDADLRPQWREYHARKSSANRNRAKAYEAVAAELEAASGQGSGQNGIGGG